VRVEVRGEESRDCAPLFCHEQRDFTCGCACAGTPIADPAVRKKSKNPPTDMPMVRPLYEHPLEPLLRLAALALLGGVVSVVWRRVSAVHRHRVVDRPRALPEKLQVWEGEGGQSQMPDLPR
jgi:hypothetical protein